METLHNSIETLYIPESVLSIEGLYRLSFYSGGHNMKTIEVSENNPNYWSDGKALYTKDKSMLIHMFDYQAEEYEVFASTKVIGEAAFSEFSNLKKLVLPEAMQEIRTDAFYDCYDLEEIVGIEKVRTISPNALSSTKYFKNRSVIFSDNVLQKYSSCSEKIYSIPEGTTKIEENAFNCPEEQDDLLEEIVVPNSVRMIGASAFEGRKKLRTVNIPEGVKRIEADAFRGCTALEKIYIPVSVDYISADSFPINETPWGRAAITSVFSEIHVAAENSIYKSIDGVLYSKDGKTLVLVPANYSAAEFVVPETVEVIGEKAFRSNKLIKKIVLTKKVKTISERAFSECKGLEEINLEEIESIGIAAFSQCVNLKSVSLKVKNVSEYAFYECENLKIISMEGTKTIERSAFEDCGIYCVDLPEGLEYIGEKAFAGCYMKSVTVPKTVLKTERECFSGCREITIFDSIDPDAKLCTEHLDDGNGYPNSLVGFIGIGFSRAMWECAANHCWYDYEIIVRSAETGEIKYKVWMGADSTQRKYYCTLSSSWGKNGSFNFSALDNIFADIKGVDHKIKVAINRLLYPEMLSETQENVYKSYLVRSAKDVVKKCIDNDDMETLIFCEKFGVIKKNNIDDLIDYAASRKAIQFTAYLLNYKNEKFGGSTGKNRMPSLSFKAEEPWVASKSVSTKVGRYKGNETDVEFPTKIKGKKMTGVAGTTSAVPENYKKIISVVLPEGYTSIGDYAFYGCTALERIVLPSTMKSIGKDAFNGCVNLKEIIMPDSVTEIGPNAFRGCTNLSKLKLSNRLKSISGYAFAGCGSLKVIELPSSITYLEKGSFEIYGVDKLIVNSLKLKTQGKCFGSVGAVYANEGVMKKVYGITKDIVHPLDEAKGEN